MNFYYLSSNKMAVGILTNNQNIIVDSPPITRKFIGQPLSNLVRWLEKQGGLTKYLIQSNIE